MKKLVLLLLLACPSFAQINLELTPQGFAPIEIPRPDVPVDKLEDRIRSWVMAFNEKNEFGYDVYEVSDRGMKIDAHRMNAFYYRNRGEVYQHRIKYNLKIDYLQTTLRVKFTVLEVYAGKNRLELRISDMFNPTNGKLKDDYLDAKPSLEKTAGKILQSLANYMAETN